MNAIEKAVEELKIIVIACEETAAETKIFRNGESRAWRAVASRIRNVIKKMQESA